MVQHLLTCHVDGSTGPFKRRVVPLPNGTFCVDLKRDGSRRFHHPTWPVPASMELVIKFSFEPPMIRRPSFMNFLTQPRCPRTIGKVSKLQMMWWYHTAIVCSKAKRRRHHHHHSNNHHHHSNNNHQQRQLHHHPHHRFPTIRPVVQKKLKKVWFVTE